MSSPLPVIDDMLRSYPELSGIEISLNYTRHPETCRQDTVISIEISAQTFCGEAARLIAPATTLQMHDYMLTEAIHAISQLLSFADMRRNLSHRICNPTGDTDNA